MRAFLYGAMALLMPGVADALDISWNNAAGGNWNLAANWSPAQVPGMNDNAFITLAGTYTVTLDGDVTVASLTLGGPSGTQTLLNPNRALTLNADSMISGHGVYTHSGGTLAGSGALTVAGAINWSAGSWMGAGSTSIAAGGTLSISGGSSKLLRRTVNNAGVTTWSGTGSLGGGDVVFTNQSGGMLDIQNDQVWSFSNGAVAPQLANQPGATLTKSAGAGTTTFSGVVVNNAGTVSVASGVLALGGGGSASGAFSIAPGSRLDVSSMYTFNAGTTVTGSGPLRITGTLDVAAGVTVPFTELTGTLTGAGTLTVGTQLSWTAGAMTGSGVTTVPSGKALVLSGGSSKLLRRTVNNAGVTTWSGTGSLGGGDVVFTNQSGGMLDIQNDQVWSFSNGAVAPQLANQPGATLTKSAGAGTTTFSGVVVNNAGTVSVASGVLALGGGGSASGAFSIAPGSRVDVTSMYTFNAGTTVTGSGPLRITGTLDVAAAVTVPFTELTGTLTGAGTLTVGTQLSWTAGAMTGSGVTTVPSGAALVLSGGSSKLLRRTVNNAGMTTWSGTGSLGGGDVVFTNQNGGMLDIQNDQVWSFSSGSVAPQLANQPGATLTKSAGAGTTTFSGVVVTNAGTVNAGSGVLTFNGPYTQTAGFTHLVGGNLSTNTTIQIQGGVLDGTGNIAGNVSNGGAVNPGTSPGRLTITGTYAQLAPGTLNVELNGLTPETQFDRINLVGQAMLAGTLHVVLGFTPAMDATFTIIDNDAIDAVSGTFANLAEGSIVNAGGTQLQISYVGGSGNDVVLRVVGAAGVTDTPTATRTITITPSQTITRTPTTTGSATPTAPSTGTPAATASSTATSTRSATATASATPSHSPPSSPTGLASPTPTVSAPASASATPTATQTSTPTTTPTQAATSSLTPTAAVSPTVSSSATASASPSTTLPPSPSPSATATASSTGTRSPDASVTPTPTPTVATVTIGGHVFRPSPLTGVAGATVRVYNCDRITLCLESPGVAPIATAVTNQSGLFTLAVPARPERGRLLLFDVTVDGQPLRHLLVMPPLPQARAARSIGRGAGGELFAPIDVISEAAVRVLEDAGIEHYDDDAIAAIVQAVRDANADTVFDGLNVADAANLATTTAANDMDVQRVLSETRATPTPTDTPGGASCAGDCDGNRLVTVNELVRGVNIALATQPAASCSAIDRNGDGAATIDELIAAVSALLLGCPATV